MDKRVKLNIHPREVWSPKKFIGETPVGSIALDGMVGGGPFYDEGTLHANFDHHSGVVREATMSTAKQVLYAIKGGLMSSWLKQVDKIDLFVNDPDQDVALATFLLTNHQRFDGTQSIPAFGRLLELSDRLDVTGGAFPMVLSDQLVKQHSWVFSPYNDLRKSGALAGANSSVMRDCLESTWSRVNQLIMGQAGEVQLDTRHEILHSSPFGYKIVNEIGGSDARYELFAKGMDAFISLIGTRSDGRNVWSVGRRSRYIPFPVTDLYSVYNEAEGLTSENGWGGSDIVGGSSRMLASRLGWRDLAELTDKYLARLKQEVIVSV